MTSRTNFRELARRKWAGDVIQDSQALNIQDRVNTLRGKTGIVTCDELGISPTVWAKMSVIQRDNARSDFWAALRIKAMTQTEFDINLLQAKKDLGIY